VEVDNDAVVKDTFINDPPPSLSTLDKTLYVNLEEPPLLSTKSLNTLAMTPHYIIVPVKEVELKKKKK
jgi:hypothetical protein